MVDCQYTFWILVAPLLLLFSLTIVSGYIPPVPISKPLQLSTSTKPKPKPAFILTKEQRAKKAKETWSTVALQPTKDETCTLDLAQVSTIYDADRFQEFCKLKGSYFINGLGSCQIGDRIMHPFEVHGLIKSLVFDGCGSLHFSKKLIQTPLTRNELEFKCPLARGVMSTMANVTFPHSIWNMMSPSDRDTANLVAYLWPPPGSNSTIDPILIVSTDNGDPYALDPATLEMKGKLLDLFPDKLMKHIGSRKLLAHPHVDAENDLLIVCISEFDFPGTNNAGNSIVEFLEFDVNYDLVRSKSLTTRFMVFHDYIVTDDYYVIPQNPAVLQWSQVAKFVVGQVMGAQVFKMDTEAVGEFVLVPRTNNNNNDDDDDTPMHHHHHVPTKDFFNIFHFGPSYQEDGKMIIHGISFDNYEFGNEGGFNSPNQAFDPIDWLCPAPRLDKFVLDLETMTLDTTERIPVIVTMDDDDVIDIPVDLPSFRQSNGNTDSDNTKLPYCRYSYFVGAARPEGWFPFRSIVKLDLETNEAWNWDAGDGQITSEPMFLPRRSNSNNTNAKEDDGYCISIVHNAEELTCRLVIWDSLTFKDGPIASVPLGDLMPWCVHGSWYPDYNP